MNRRQTLFSGIAILALAGCSSLPTLPVKVTAPPELQQLIDDARSVVAKIESLASSLPASALSLLAEGKSLVASISAAGSLGGVTGFVGKLVPIVQQLTAFLPTTGGAGDVVAAIETVLPVIAQVAGIVAPFLRRGRSMGLAQARAILRS